MGIEPERRLCWSARIGLTCASKQVLSACRRVACVGFTALDADWRANLALLAERRHGRHVTSAFELQYRASSSACVS